MALATASKYRKTQKPSNHDVMIAALTDTIGDHPELLQAHDQVGGPNRLMRQFLEASAAEPSMSRAILAAYKDELLKGPTLPHKFNFEH